MLGRGRQILESSEVQLDGASHDSGPPPDCPSTNQQSKRKRGPSKPKLQSAAAAPAAAAAAPAAAAPAAAGGGQQEAAARAELVEIGARLARTHCLMCAWNVDVYFQLSARNHTTGRDCVGDADNSFQVRWGSLALRGRREGWSATRADARRCWCKLCVLPAFLTDPNAPLNPACGRGGEGHKAVQRAGSESTEWRGARGGELLAAVPAAVCLCAACRFLNVGLSNKPDPPTDSRCSCSSTTAD